MGTKKITAQLCIVLCLAASAACAQQKVVLDNYYNHETSPKTGKPYHYLWDDEADSGFSQFGDLFRERGAEISTLNAEPEGSSLKEVSVYIIVDPDTPAETKEPNYMTDKAAAFIARWVKKGGVLLLMSNDKNNAEFDHFNLLAEKFGMQFNKELLHPVEGKKFDMGASVDLPEHPLFRDLKKIYMKEVASITCCGKAKPVLTENDKTIIAECRYGKGYVLAVGDPWIYNEYIGHSRLPEDFENMQAARNLVTLLLSNGREY
jgi:unsaturated rhamnogalacturonyl hydrolase